MVAVTVPAPAPVPDLVEVVAERLAAVRRTVVEAGRDPAAVTVVAVTKGQPVAACEAAIANGLVDLGESYAQELGAKAAELGAGATPRWHFIGGVQRRKVRSLAGLVDLWQSVDRLELVDELAARAPGAAVLVQVALTDDPGRSGCSPAAAPGLVVAARERGLDVRGLMAVGPPGGGPEAARPGFRLVAAMAADLGLGTVSLGMSGDLRVALEEGTTMVRLGSTLFGPRGTHQPVRAWDDR